SPPPAQVIIAPCHTPKRSSALRLYFPLLLLRSCCACGPARLVVARSPPSTLVAGSHLCTGCGLRTDEFQRNEAVCRPRTPTTVGGVVSINLKKIVALFRRRRGTSGKVAKHLKR
ncbi:unnamed protein product, partial [Ectocarpus sp. 4 AP-2014]